MAKIKVKDLKNLIKNLDEEKEMVIINGYAQDPPRIELIKEIEPAGIEYYKVTL